MGKDPKICKCGHLKKNHQIKNQKYSTGECQSCHCSSYMNRKYPDITSKFLFLFGIIMISLIVVAFVIGFVIDYPKSEVMIEIPYGTLVILLGCILLLVSAYGLVPSLIEPYLKERKRKSHPIAEVTDEKP